MRWRHRILIWICVLAPGVAGQAQERERPFIERPFSFIVKGNYTTGSQVLPSFNSADPLLLSQPYGGRYTIDSFFGYGAELRYRLPETHVALGLSADYIRMDVDRPFLPVNGRAIPAQNTFTLVPVELTGYFIIPASTQVFRIFMGGGGGVYFGRHTFRVGNTEANSVKTQPGFGIHVLGGVGFNFTDRISIMAEMKFRDLQFRSVNAFPSRRVNYNGVLVTIPQQIDENVHADGMVFQIGAAFSF